MPRRVLFSAFGSAGDLFPLIAVAERLSSAGHEVRFVVSRALSLYLRLLRMPMVSVGDGKELRVLEDPRIASTRFDGWASWRLTMTDYVRPTLRQDVKIVTRLIDDWSPDVLVNGSFAVPARIAACLTGRDCVEMTIYPQQDARLLAARSFADRCRSEIADLVSVSRERRLVTELMWGLAGDGVVLHDPAVLNSEAIDRRSVVGFPYWDKGPELPNDATRAQQWLASSDPRPTVLVTLGSFLGVRQRQSWLEAVAAVDELGCRALFVGPHGHWDDIAFAGTEDRMAVGFVQLSALVGKVDAVVHHGGVGTMFSALRAGKPAVVMPQAFDQPHNGRLVERLGVGLVATRCGLSEALARMLNDKSFGARAVRVSGLLVPADVAADRAAGFVLDRAS